MAQWGSQQLALLLILFSFSSDKASGATVTAVVNITTATENVSLPVTISDGESPAVVARRLGVEYKLPVRRAPQPPAASACQSSAVQF